MHWRQLLLVHALLLRAGKFGGGAGAAAVAQRRVRSRQQLAVWCVEWWG
jgi:hypothetical protein